MAHIRLDDKQIELSVGELTIGTDDDAGVRLDGGAEKGNLAIVTVDRRGTATVRRGATGAAVLVNGVALGAEPAPLLHGDRIEVAGRQLRFSDDRTAGSTVVMRAFGGPAAATSPSSGRGRVGVTGGRLVSLVDGREYTIPPSGLRIGRDADCDIVVPGTEVSRNHAAITVGPSGYVVRDLSANGVFINNARTGDAQLLRRGDVIRVGAGEFRFYADQAAPSPALAAEAPGITPLLATLEIVNEGVSKGLHFDVRTPLAHVGRGPHNDVVVTDGSVSDSHAKLQRRASGWSVVDLDSKNGTYVGGRRIRGEQALDSTAAVRFGGVKVIFRAAPEIAEADGGTRTIVGDKPSDRQRAPMARPIVAARGTEASDSTETARGVSALVWIAAAAVVGATILFVIQDR